MNLSLNKKKKLSFRRNSVVLSLVFILVICGVLNIFQKEIRSFIYNISSPFQSILWKAGDNTSDFLDTIFDYDDIKNQKENILKENQELLSRLVETDQLRAENEELKKALELNLSEDFNLVQASIVQKENTNDILVLNKGRQDGIEVGMPVISHEKVLYGKINETYDKFSKVILISDKEISFDAEIFEKDVSGIIKGKGGFEIFFDLIPRDKEVVVGDTVITSSISGFFPKGLLIGKIKEVIKSDIDPIQKAEISSFFDLSNANSLFIIKDF